jgi:glyoxylase-like metal-dependent hydrolase (beta-lactamase superfamily II)
MLLPSRRTLCKFGLAFTALAAVPSVIKPKISIAGTVGLSKGKLSSFSDGNFTLPGDIVFPDAPVTELETILGVDGKNKNSVSRPVNINLLELGERKILFDAGSGVNFFPSLGKLPGALSEAGVDPLTITDVLFTHAHPDHIWGILDDFDDLLMPDANYFISRLEWEFWDSDDALASMAPGRENFAVGAKTRFDAIRNNVKLFEMGDEVLPKIEAVDSRGHTPGHTSFLINDDSQAVMIAGDVFLHDVVPFSHPKWVNGNDLDHEKATLTRLRLLDRLASEKIIFYATHLPAPGPGYVEKNGFAWRYLPVD